MGSKWTWLVLACMIISCQCESQWKTNENVMDLVIAVRYEFSLTVVQNGNAVVDGLVEILNEFTKKFQVSQDNVRMAIVEFGDTPLVRLAIKDGIDRDSVSKAIKGIGKNSFAAGKEYNLTEVATDARSLVFKGSDRIHVPKLVIIFTSATKDDLEAEKPKVAYYRIVKTMSGTHVVGLDNYGSATAKVSFLMAYSIPGLKATSYKGSQKDPTDLATALHLATGQSLQQCQFKDSTSDCYSTAEGKCVADMFYEVAYYDGTDPYPERWQESENYCFKNGSTTSCPDEKCLTTAETTTTTTTTTSTVTTMPKQTPSTAKTTETSINGKNDSDTKKPAAVQGTPDGSEEGSSTGTQVGIGLGVTFGILLIIAGVVVAVIIVRRRRQKKKEKQTQATHDGPPEWNVTPPPELSITPPEELIKQYYKKKTIPQAKPKSKKR